MIVRGLYGMVDLPPTANAEAVTALAGALIGGGAGIVQLRMKGADAATLLRYAGPLARSARELGVTFIVNDRLDVALAAGADGVHLGQDDLPLAAARAIVPAGFVIGISTHDEAQARAAVDGGADYVAFGPCFATSSKRNPDPVVGLERLARACAASSPVPVVAIGGIGLDTVGAVASAGAAAAAIIRAVNSAADVRAAAAAVTSAFAAAAR